MHGRRGTRSTATPLILLLIASILGTAITTTASAGAGSIRVYLVNTISTCINIVCKLVTNIAKDI